MKKLIALILSLTFVVVLVGCSLNKNNKDVMEFTYLTGCVLEMGYTEEDLEEDLLGQSREKIITAWGEPNGNNDELSDGDTWVLNEESKKCITLGYDEYGYVTKITLSYIK